ncbi:hypothetical protein [Photobacterium leiognathi]|uniref:hypothetical protein n=1 Tax=Photobacterium leiognathi TaxID=553611 RepID=UPI002980C0F5|nr:hypothetical protein [Photobacterium leiognathi]
MIKGIQFKEDCHILCVPNGIQIYTLNQNNKKLKNCEINLFLELCNLDTFKMLKPFSSIFNTEIQKLNQFIDEYKIDNYGNIDKAISNNNDVINLPFPKSIEVMIRERKNIIADENN